MTPCDSCGFELWNPVAEFGKSDLGLYSDGRFPGRCILSFRQHYDQFIDLPDFDRNVFMAEVTTVARAVKSLAGVRRVNISLLGNEVQHVHAHIIPRRPLLERFPERSPWNDPRPWYGLEEEEAEQIKSILILELSGAHGA